MLGCEKEQYFSALHAVCKKILGTDRFPVFYLDFAVVYWIRSEYECVVGWDRIGHSRRNGDAGCVCQRAESGEIDLGCDGIDYRARNRDIHGVCPIGLPGTGAEDPVEDEVHVAPPAAAQVTFQVPTWECHTVTEKGTGHIGRSEGCHRDSVYDSPTGSVSCWTRSYNRQVRDRR